MDIKALFEAAHAANIVHFPNAIVIVRANGKWRATIMKSGDEAPSGKSSHGCGDSAEEAVEDARASIEIALRNRIESSERDAREAGYVLASIAKKD